MTATTDAIARYIAALSREVPQPSAPFGYGVDLACVSDVTVDLQEVDPLSTTAIAEALLRRLQTAHGTMFDDPDYGLDVIALLNRGVTTTDLRGLEGKIRNECAKDDRVDAVTVAATLTGTVLAVQISATSLSSNEAFSFTFAVTDGATTLELLA